MMKMKRLMCIVVCFMLMVVLMPVMTVYAGTKYENLPEDRQKIAQEAYAYLIQRGYTPQSACGMLGNACTESDFDHNATNSSGTVKSYFQMHISEDDGYKGFKSWLQSSGGGLSESSIIAQIKFIEEVRWKSRSWWIKALTIDEFKKIDNVELASDLWCAVIEACVNGSYELTALKSSDWWGKINSTSYRDSYVAKGYQDAKLRRELSSNFLKNLANIDVSTVVPEEGQAELSDGTVVKDGEYGFINSDGLFVSLEDSIIEFKAREDLSDSQIKGVVDWRDNIKFENEGFLVKALRVFVMFLGILMLVWVIFVYLSYWFDRVNNFIDIDFLPILTAGRLRISPEENECTFNPKNFVKGESQTVNHRVIIGVCALGILFSVLVISGTFYKWLGYLIRYVLGLLGVM